MLGKISKIFVVVSVICLGQIGLKAQATQAGGWIRVETDDGEFSIEVPSEYRYFEDSRTFLVARNRKRFNLQNMKMLNSYVEGTLVSFEIYDGKLEALEAIMADDKDIRTSTDKLESSRLKDGGRQLIRKSDQLFSKRQYFFSKSHIYVLTAGSRGSETPQMKRFFTSLKFVGKTESQHDEIVTKMSSLPVSKVDIKFEIESAGAGQNPITSTKNENPTRAHDRFQAATVIYRGSVCKKDHGLREVSTCIWGRWIHIKHCCNSKH